MDSKKPAPSRRVWRMTPDSPHGALVEFDPAAPQRTVARAEAVPKVLDPAPVVDWRASSYDLLNGVEICDQSESIPGDLFDELFKR